MASKKQRPRNNPRKSNDFLAQLGIPDVSGLDMDNIYGAGGADDDDEEDLESELNALLSGQSVPKAVEPKRKPTRSGNVFKMPDEYMKDSDEDDENLSGDDEDLSGDEELMNELAGITGEAKTPSPIPDEIKPDCSTTSVSALLSERLSLYKDAEAAARLYNDNSKVRRYGRAIKTLQEQLKAVNSGCIVNEEDIPPVVTIPKPKAVCSPEKNVDPLPLPPEENMDSLPPLQKSIDPSPKTSPSVPRYVVPLRPVPPLPISSQSSVPSDGSDLVQRRNQYKLAALNARKCGDNETALMYVKIAKKFDAVIEAQSKGQPVDLSNCPPPPSKYTDQNLSLHPNVPPTVVAQQSPAIEHNQMEQQALAAANEPPDPGLFNAPPPPATVLEALNQRLEKYCITRDAAKDEGNKQKQKRLDRIVKQYEGAIKAHKAGKPYDFDELPTPPGYGPIPTENKAQTVASESSKTSPVLPPVARKPKVEDSPLLGKEDPTPKDVPSSTRNPRIQRANTSSILDKQLHFLLERQKLFRQAALESKKNGDMQQAKEYLRMSKGFDSMIEATKNGLPIDATTIPTPPQLEGDFVIVDQSELLSSDEHSPDEMYPVVEKDLQHQIAICDKNKNHFLSLGDVSSASKFEKLSLDSKKDLVAIQHFWRTGTACPAFHYETRVFSLVQCNTELSDSDLEVTIERGINLPGNAATLDTYVKIELPIPSEYPQSYKTHTVRDTNNPNFQATFKFELNRKSRSQVRQFKRIHLKCEVWSKRGMFQGDKLLGTVNVKLSDLESKCSIHNSFDLMEGRRPCGGKLEVKVNVRDPLLVKQIEEVKEKWLVIDSFSSNTTRIKH